MRPWTSRTDHGRALQSDSFFLRQKLLDGRHGSSLSLTGFGGFTGIDSNAGRMTATQ